MQKTQCQQLVSNKEKLLASATIEFGMQGYLNASTNQICKDAHVSKGLLYHYFSTKKELFEAVFSQCVDDLERAMSPIFCDKQVYDLAYIEVFYKERITFFLNHPNHFHIIMDAISGRLGTTHDVIKKRRSQTLKSFKEILAAILQQQPMQEGITREQAIELILAVSNYTLNKYIITYQNDNISCDSLIENFQKEHRQMLHMILDGVITQK